MLQLKVNPNQPKSMILRNIRPGVIRFNKILVASIVSSEIRRTSIGLSHLQAHLLFTTHGLEGRIDCPRR